MLHYLVTPSHRYTMDSLLAQEWGAHLRDRVRVLTYPEAEHELGAPGAYVFTDMDRLNPEWLERTAAMWKQLEGREDVVTLNDPRIVLGRHALLTRLHDEGWNGFEVALLNDRHLPPRPLFLRHAVEHTGNLTPLLRTGPEVRNAARDLMARGYRPKRLMAVEFCDTSEPDGRFRKYSAFRVGDRIIPRYLSVASSWMVKTGAREVDETTARLEYDYVTRNPHAESLAAIFRIANIDYGRIDYGLKDGRVQTWEINVNPMIGRHMRKLGSPSSPEQVRSRKLRRPALEVFYREFSDAITTLAAGRRPRPTDPPPAIDHHGGR